MITGSNDPIRVLIARNQLMVDFDRNPANVQISSDNELFNRCVRLTTTSNDSFTSELPKIYVTLNTCYIFEPIGCRSIPRPSLGLVFWRLDSFTKKQAPTKGWLGA